MQLKTLINKYISYFREHDIDIEAATNLGSGSYGFVISGTNIANTITYAIKFQPIDTMNISEIDLMTRFKHPNIIDAKILFHDSYIIYIMKRGIPLEKVYMKLSNMDKYKLIYDIASGLSFMHKNGYYHCDLKIENIIYLNYRAVIIDYSLSGSSDSHVCNTVHLRPPEINNNINYTFDQLIKADSWAFGCLIYHIFTGENMFWNYSISISKDINIAIQNAIKQYLKAPQFLLKNVKDLNMRKVVSMFTTAQSDIRFVPANLYFMEPFITLNWRQPLSNARMDYNTYMDYSYSSDKIFTITTAKIISTFKEYTLNINTIFIFFDLLYRCYPHYITPLSIYSCAYIAMTILNNISDIVWYPNHISISTIHKFSINIINYILNIKKEPLLSRTLYDDSFSAANTEYLISIINKDTYYTIPTNKRLDFMIEKEKLETKSEFYNRKPKETATLNMYS